MKNTFTTYFERYAYPKTLVNTAPDKELGMIIVIPCYNEPELLFTLECINGTQLPVSKVEVLVIVNEFENAPLQVSIQNQKSYNEAVKWSGKFNNSHIQYHILYINDIPKKKHGVGFARKIGMDEAARRFMNVKRLHKGIIVAFDADTSCRQDYLIEIDNHFNSYTKCVGVSTYFEHPYKQIKEKHTREGILQYELHLRYLVHAQRYAGFTQAFHTVGSSMAIRADAYIRAGGMNTRKAGEDFYFLHRIISMGNYMELNTAVVYPSARKSNRVPFGTGRAMLNWTQNQRQSWLTSNPNTFSVLKSFLSKIDRTQPASIILEGLHESMISFLQNDNFQHHWKTITSGTNAENTFQKRFTQYFDAFKVLKFMHYSRDNYFKDVPVNYAALWLLKNYFHQEHNMKSTEDLLKIYRKIDRGFSSLNQKDF